MWISSDLVLEQSVKNSGFHGGGGMLPEPLLGAHTFRMLLSFCCHLFFPPTQNPIIMKPCHSFTYVVEKANSVAWMLTLVSRYYFWLSRRSGNNMIFSRRNRSRQNRNRQDGINPI